MVGLSRPDPLSRFLCRLLLVRRLATIGIGSGLCYLLLAIFCFLAGALWGQAQRSDEALSVPTLLISNGLVLFAVTALLTAQAMLASVLLALGYLALLWFDLRTSSQERWYLVMRKRLTLGVFAAHLIYVSRYISAAHNCLKTQRRTAYRQ